MAREIRKPQVQLVIGSITRTTGLHGPALLYFLVVVVTGSVIFGINLTHLKVSFFGIYFIWTFLTFVSEKLMVSFFGYYLTVSCALHVSAYILFDIPTAVFTAVLATIISDFTSRRDLHKAAFNAAQSAITICLAGPLFYAMKQSTDTVFSLRHDFLAFFLSYLVYTVVNTVLVWLIVALTSGQKLSSVIQKNIRVEVIHSPTVFPIAPLIVYLYQQEPLSLVFLAMPLLMAHLSFKNYAQLHLQTIATMEVLADIIDRRDPYTAKHSQRVAKLAEATAWAMGLSAGEVEEIGLAGRVHDIGKVAISDYILLKNGSLSPWEYEVVKSHPRIGFNILSELRLYKKCAPYVLYHHEHFDGTGYPEGLKGEAIPLGARILAVADTYDAMTTDRPYRRALTRQQALSELRRCSGTQFDPAVVNAFLATQEQAKSLN
ncbi:MAG: HD-GYP domain-containing protein [Desulfotomaculales bacterium]